MSLTLDQLIYDPAANEGAKVGAFIIDADGHQVDVNADGSLNVVGSFSIAPGTEIKITDGTDDLAVNPDGSINAVVSATDLDIRDLAFATDKVDVSNSVVALDSATLAALENINAVVTATDLDIRNLVFATDKVDASGSSVSVSNKPIVNETNNSIKNSAFSATTTAALLTPTPLTNRKSLIVQNLGNKEIYIGDSGVTSSNGVKISAGANAELKFDSSVALYARTASGTADVRILEAANS